MIRARMSQDRTVPLKTFPVFEKLGGLDAVHQQLRRAGYRRSRDALRMQVSAGSIPGRAIVLLMEICERGGIEYRAADFRLATIDVSRAA